MRALVALLGFILSLPLMVADKKPLTKEESAKVIETAISKAAKRPTGELSKEDYAKVTKLDLSNNQLRDLTALENLSQLEELSVSVNGLSNLMPLDKLLQLKALALHGYLFGNQFTPTTLPTGLDNLTQLKVLSINVALTDLESLEKLTQLEQLSLSLGNNGLTGLPKGLEKLTQLKVLVLNSNELADVKGLDKLTELTTLVLMGNQLTDVRGLGKLTKLTTLILNGNRLAQLPKGLANLKQLEYLDLRLNEITDVSDLKKLSTLTELQLSDNPSLTKAQIDKLQKALPICKIKHNAKK